MILQSNTPYRTDRNSMLMKILIGLLAIILILVLSTTSGCAQTLWSSSGGSAWLTGTNWTGSTVPASTGYAQFGVNPTSGTTGVGINMNGTSPVGAQGIGAIELTNARVAALIIGNSSTSSAGVLTFNGTTVNSVANTIIRNNSAQLLTLQNIQGSGTSTMGVALGNATNNIVNIDGTGGVTISSIVSGSGKLTLGGSGSGTLTLSAANTFTGGLTVSSGIVSLGNAAAAALD